MSTKSEILTRRLLCAACLAGLWNTGSLAQTSDTSQAKPGNAVPDAGLEEIVVTATKTSEKVMDIPSKIDVVSAAQIVNLGITNFQDYASLVPNLNQSSGRGGGEGNIVLRGLYTGNLQYSATTAIYVDEAAFTPDGEFGLGATVTVDPDLFGGTQVEVLKGPQGTLYGASSLGGLVRIQPKQPDPHDDGLHGRVELGGDFASGGQSGAVEKGSFDYTVVPDELAIGGSAFNREDPGFIKDVGTGRTDLGRLLAHGFSGSAVFTPTDDLKIRGFFFDQTDQNQGLTYQDNILGTSAPHYGDREQKRQVPENSAVTSRLYEFVADYRTAIGTASVIYVNTHLENNLNLDYSQSYGTFLFGPQGALAGTLGAFGLPNYAGAGILTTIGLLTTSQNEEVRFNSERLGNFQFLLGFYHSAQKSDFDQSLTDFLPGTETPLPTIAAFDFANALALTLGSTFDELAGYGNVKYFVTDQIDIEGGFRYTHDSQSFNAVEQGILTGFASDTLNENFDEDARLYSASVSWHPTPVFNAYLHSASGFRPGGVNGSPFAAAAGYKGYGSDMTYDYEGGIKGTLLGNHLSYDFSAYHIDWKNVQLNSTIRGLSVLLNSSGGASINGTEFTLQYRADNGLSAGGSFGYNISSLGPVAASVTATSGAKQGDQLPGSPKITFAVYGDYRFDLPHALLGDVGATLRYQGDKNSSYPAAQNDLNWVIPSYTTLDLRGSISLRELTFRAAVTNLTNANGFTGADTLRVAPIQNVPTEAYLIRPREFKLTVSYDF